MPKARLAKLQTVLAPTSRVEWRKVSEILRLETIGGSLLIVAAVIAVGLANSPFSEIYHQIQHTYLGITLGEFSFKLSLAHWAADGLLAIFFFLVGLELKREFIAGELRHFDRALVPVAAAFGGVITPALIYVGFNLHSGGLSGWAIPSATDIAFAVAVLSVVGTSLPSALRTFLLTLAVADDLIAIVIIAIFYTKELHLQYLLIAIIPIVIYLLLVNRHRDIFKHNESAAWLFLLPLGIITWFLFFKSGIHATIAGVVLAFCVPVKDANGKTKNSLAENLEHRLRPLSAGFAVPVFAFFSSGVSFPTLSTITTPISLGIIIGLVVGKILGVSLSTFLVTRLRKANLDPSVTWPDIIGVSMLAGIGFTVSQLVSELSFTDPHDIEHAKAAVLVGSVIAATVGGIYLSWRASRIKNLEISEEDFC